MEMNFCRRCGESLVIISPGLFTCANKHKLYVNAAPATGVFFVDDDKNVLLSVRGIEPHKGKLDTIGGFVEEHESIEQALAREIREEIGLEPDQYDPPKYLCSSTSLYPYDGEERTIIGILYWSRLKPGARPIANDDVAALATIPLDEIQSDAIGNDDVRFGLVKLREIFNQ